MTGDSFADLVVIRETSQSLWLKKSSLSEQTEEQKKKKLEKIIFFFFEYAYLIVIVFIILSVYNYFHDLRKWRVMLVDGWRQK